MNKIALTFLVLFTFISLNCKAETTQKSQTAAIFERIESWYEENMSYPAVTALMIVESSFVPFPSEIVVPPAAYIASKPESKLNIYLVVLFATMGALIGAYINYGLALWLGRPLVYKLANSKVGRLFLLSSEKIERAENYFNKHGKVSTLIGRLIPGIRQLISIPAGLAKMNFISFTLYTLLGAAIWNSTLALLGYIAHGKSELIYQYSHLVGIAITAICLLTILFFGIKRYRKKAKKQ